VSRKQEVAGGKHYDKRNVEREEDRMYEAHERHMPGK